MTKSTTTPPIDAIPGQAALHAFAEASTAPEFRDILAAAKELAGAELITPQEQTGIAPFAILPTSRRIESLESLRQEFEGRLPHPSRCIASVTLTDLASFSAYLARHRDPARTVVYVRPPLVGTPSFTAIFNEDASADHELAGRPGRPGWRDHRATYVPKFDPRWLAWQALDGKEHVHGDFAKLVDQHRLEFLPVSAATPALIAMLEQAEFRLGGPASLFQAARNFSLNASVAVAQAVSLDTGEVVINYSEEHNAKDGQGAPVKLPNAYIVGVPVFIGGPVYQMLVLLRYRRHQNQLVWRFERFEAARIAEAAFDEMLATLRATAEVPVLLGEAPDVRSIDD